MGLWRRIGENLRDVKVFGPAVLMRFFRDGTPVHLKNIGPVSLRRQGSDFECFRLVFAKGDYDLRYLSAVHDRIERRYHDILALGRTPLIVDAGANVGASAIWFSRLFPKARVKAVEPDEANFDLLQSNTSAIDTIEPQRAAIGSESGFVKLIASPDRGDAVQTVRAGQGMKVVSVADIQASVPDSSLFLVKVDIEGFEKDLFASNLDWVKDAYVVVVEPHDWMLPGQFSSKPFMTAMANDDFEMFIVGENLFFVRN